MEQKCDGDTEPVRQTMQSDAWFDVPPYNLKGKFSWCQSHSMPLSAQMKASPKINDIRVVCCLDKKIPAITLTYNRRDTRMMKK